MSEEKGAQMLCVWQQKAAVLVDEAGRFDRARAEAQFGDGHGHGMPASGPRRP
jgi:beta-glucosidase